MPTTTTTTKNTEELHGKTAENLEELCGKTAKELGALNAKFDALQQLEQNSLAGNAGVMKARADSAKKAENFKLIRETLRNTIDVLRQEALRLQQNAQLQKGVDLEAQQQQGFSLGLGGSGGRESENGRVR